MRSNIIYAKSKHAFQELPIEEFSNSLVFIEDTHEIWIKNKYFKFGSPAISVTEENDIVSVNIGDGRFSMGSSSSGLTIRKSGNNIIFSSSSLTTINTISPLTWEDNILSHDETDVTPGNYGATTASDNENILSIPYFSVNRWGHITDAETKVVRIRDYVEQLSTSNISGNFNLLLGYSDSNSSETNVVRKSDIVLDNISKKLTLPGGLEVKGDSKITGNFVVEEGQIIGDVQGNITGTATPKIHLSDEPEYGGASTKLYGHVKLQDELLSEPLPSSVNADPSSSTVTRGVAASPKMVWDVKEEIKGIIIDSSVKGITVNNEEVPKEKLTGIIAIETKGGTTAGVDPETGNIVISSVSISGFDNNKNELELNNKLKFTKDFTVDNDEVSLRWELIE